MSLLALLLLVTLGPDTGVSHLPKGTIIKLKLTQPVSSELAAAGEVLN
jgi:hypothetical protein